MEDLLTVNVYLSTVSIFGNIESQQRFCFLLQIIIYLHFRSWQRINTTSSCLNKCSSKLSSLEIFPTKVLIMKTFLIPERFMLTGSTWLLEYSMINIYQENILKNYKIRSFVTNCKTIAVTSHLIFHFAPLVCQLCIAIAECSDYISAEKDHKTKFSTRKVNPGDPL